MRSIAPPRIRATDQKNNPAEAPSLNRGYQTPIAIDADALDEACERRMPPVPDPLPGSLGNSAESSSPSPKKFGKDRGKCRKNRDGRYVDRAIGRDLAFARGKFAGMNSPADIHRITRCGCVPIKGHRYVEIMQSTEHGTAHYAGLQQCGSPWACPVCAAKIAERRREEIAAGFDYAYTSGRKVVMVTFTFSHTAWDSVTALLRQQSDALRRLRSGKVWQRIKGDMGYGGLIRSLEITHGRNGWHPHTHEAWIVSNDTDAEALRERVSQRWAASCRRAGLLKPSQEADFARHAVHVVDRATSSDYMAKHDQESHWGADRELAAGSSKVSAGRHPFALLRDAGAGDEEAGDLYMDFVEATKGKAQIFWSRGLKAAAGVQDRTDDEVVEEQEEPAVAVAAFDFNQWQQVTRERAQAEMLNLVEDEGWIGLARWFRARDMRPPQMPDSSQSGSPSESPP